MNTSHGGHIINTNLEVGDKDYMIFESQQDAKKFITECITNASKYAKLGYDFWKYCNDTDEEPDIELFTALRQVMKDAYTLNLITISFHIIKLREQSVRKYFKIVEV